jgi:hypothetical protein
VRILNSVQDRRCQAGHAFLGWFHARLVLGGWGWVYGILPNSRILHQAHEQGGAIRFNQAGEEASYNTDIGIITYKHRSLGHFRYLSYTTPHDRSDDALCV